MPKISIIIMLVGIALIVAPLAVPQFSVIYVTGDYTINGIPAVSSVPSSSSASSPTTFSANGYANIWMTWQEQITQITGVTTSGTGTASVSITDSAGYSTSHTLGDSWQLQWAKNPLTNTWIELFTADTAVYNFTNPYPTQSNVYTFTFSGYNSYKASNATATFNYATTARYGEFPLQTIQGLGHFYFALGNTAPVQITSVNTQLYYNVSGTSTTFQVWYVEDAGTTTPFSYAYITYQWQFQSSVTTLTLGTQTTLNGYTAYTSSPITIPVPTLLTVNGYLVATGAAGSPFNLMYIFGNWGNSTPVTPQVVLTENQEITMGIGAFVLIVGVALFVTKRW